MIRKEDLKRLHKEFISNDKEINQTLLEKIKRQYNITKVDDQWYTMFKNFDFEEIVLDKQFGIYLADDVKVYPNGEMS